LNTADTSKFRELLVQGLLQLELDAKKEHIDRFFQYLSILLKWNRRFNLVANNDMKELITRHLLDSVTIYPYLTGENILDVGSGNGFPGIPLAILFPEKALTLVDSNSKKTRFLRQVAIELNLTNVSVMQGRIEEIETPNKFDQAISRAYTNLPDLVRSVLRLMIDSGELLCFKGRLEKAQEELDTIDNRLIRIHGLNVPFIGMEQRHLIIYRFISEACE
jgi:16S rRNA (guanine527-N7)-methyltransferase